MKRTPLKRTPMRRKRGSTSYSRRVRDFSFMGWVKTQPCAIADLTKDPGWSQCDGGIEADHAGGVGQRGLGMKADDSTVIPLCSKHHRERTDRTGYFRGMRTWELRDWCNLIITRLRAAYEARSLRTNF